MKTKDKEKILEYLPMVKNIAIKIYYGLPKTVELEDLINSGILGLIDAIEKYDKTTGVKFEYYARIRVKGAILDELRNLDLLPRSARERKKEIEAAYLNLEKKKGKPPTDEEVAEYLNIDVTKLRDLLFHYRGDKIISFNNYSESENNNRDELILYYLQDHKEPSPNDKMFFSELKNVLAKAIKELPEREKLLITLYYYEDLNQKEIGKIMGITESRVSQLRSQAIARLRGKIDQFYKINIKGGKDG